MTTRNSALWDAASAENADSSRIGIPSDRREPRDPFRGEERSKGEEKALAAVAANRDNPTFKNRRNALTRNEKTFSNRDKNGISGLPHFRPPSLRVGLFPSKACRPKGRRYRTWERHSPEWRPVSRLVVGLPRQSGDWRSRENQNGLDPILPVDDDFADQRKRKVRS
jgi:hypothetical protein